MFLVFFRVGRDKKWATVSGEMWKRCGVIDPRFLMGQYLPECIFLFPGCSEFLTDTTFGLCLHFTADCAATFWKSRSNCSASVWSHLSSKQASQGSKLCIIR